MTQAKIRFGICGTAKIAREWVIPAIKNSKVAQCVAVASRTLDKAQDYACEHAIAHAFGNYESMFASDLIDAVYIATPNQLHVELTALAAKYGKHVLCEKPIAMNAKQAETLTQIQREHNRVVLMEAFMYRFHPQWIRIKKMIINGELGDIQHVESAFTYNNTDPKNVRNRPETGGGALMDVGCYCVSVARFIFGVEPEKVTCNMQLDPVFKTDKHTTGIMQFANGSSTFFCSTQSQPSQHLKIIGSKATLIAPSPFYKRETPATLIIRRENSDTEILVGQHDHYLEQINAFCHAILNSEPAPTPLNDALNNMRVIDALKESASSAQWADLG